jgi:hypothetical protein
LMATVATAAAVRRARRHRGWRPRHGDQPSPTRRQPQPGPAVEGTPTGTDHEAFPDGARPRFTPSALVHAPPRKFVQCNVIQQSESTLAKILAEISRQDCRRRTGGYRDGVVTVGATTRLRTTRACAMQPPVCR